MNFLIQTGNASNYFIQVNFFMTTYTGLYFYVNAMEDDFSYSISRLDDVIHLGLKLDAKNCLVEAIEFHNDFLR